MDFPISIWSATLLALVLAFIARRAHRNLASLPQMEKHAPGTSAPDCMVVIPARNEDQLIARAVKSLPRDSVIVVDDRSTDKTAAIARDAGAGVLRAPKLLRGGNGKSNACAEGARVLSSKWILFADADTWFEEGFLESAIASASAIKADFLSIYLRPEFETWAERMISPLAVMLYSFGVNAVEAPADAFSGQCILARRQAYEFVGGHGTIVKELNEDLKLAALALRHRMRIAVVRADNLGHVRIRTEAFARQTHRFTQVSIWIGARLVLAACAFALWGPITLWLILSKQWITAGALYLWLVALLGSPYQGFHRALLAPLGIYRLSAILSGGLFSVATGRSVTWKGRVI
jgi:glycosyltransferase involved in cell wall biosynthesis